MDNREVSRRAFLGGAVAASVGTMITGSSAQNPPHPDPVARDTGTSDAGASEAGACDALDEALARMASKGPEYAGGLANHGPMATEALVTLGRPDAVERWVDRYAPHLQERPGPRDAIQSAAWQEALGDFARAGDWRVFFERQLEEAPWSSVISTWAPRLAPGLGGVAMHGVIRTGHAARALAARVSPQRRHELAEGLAYWAARFERLPESGKHIQGTAMPSAALRSVQPLPADRQLRSGFISTRLSRLADFPPFQGVADMVDTSADGSLFLGDLAGAMADNFIHRAHNPGLLIALIHAVTGPSSLRPLLPHVDAAGRSALLRYAWQAAAAVYATHTGSERTPPVEAPSIAELAERAVRNGDEHAIKFTEACLREHRLDPRPIYLTAAAEAIARLS